MMLDIQIVKWLPKSFVRMYANNLQKLLSLEPSFQDAIILKS